MAKQTLQVAISSFTAYVRIVDVNGSPITGLVYNSSGLLSKYILPGAASVAITLATQTTTGAYSSGGFVEMDATAFPGLYRFDIPNAAFASGNSAFVSLYGYSGMAAAMLEFELVAYNPQSATFAANLTQILGTALTETTGFLAAGFKAFFNIASPVFTVASVNQTGDSYARLGAPAGASIAADIAALAAAAAAAVWGAATRTLSAFGFTVGTVTNLTNAPTAGDFTATMKASLGTAMGTAQTGDSYARLGTPAGASVSADIAAVKSNTTSIASSISSGLTLTSSERNSIANALLDLANGTEAGYTLRQATRLMLSALAGKLSGAAGTTITIRDVNDSVNRIVATVDASGDRTALTLDVS